MYRRSATTKHTQCSGFLNKDFLKIGPLFLVTTLAPFPFLSLVLVLGNQPVDHLFEGISYCPLISRTYPGPFWIYSGSSYARLFANTVAELWSLKLTHHCPWQHLCFPICMFFVLFAKRWPWSHFPHNMWHLNQSLSRPEASTGASPENHHINIITTSSSQNYHHHHFIMSKLSSSPHHHVEIIIVIMIIIMSSRQKASRARSVENTFFWFYIRNISLNMSYHKEISWNAAD